MNDHDKSTTEIAIVGAGNTAARAGAGMAQQGFTVMVIEHAAPAPFVADSQPGRADFGPLARYRGAAQGLGVWEAGAGCAAIPIGDWRPGSGKTPMWCSDAAELKLPLLGYMQRTTSRGRCGRRWKRAHLGVTLRVPVSLAALHRRRDGYALNWPTAKGNAEVSDWRRFWRESAFGKWRNWHSCPQYAQPLITVGRKCAATASTGSSLRQRGRAPFCRCSTIGASLVWYDAPARIRQLQSLSTQLQVEINFSALSGASGAVMPVAAGAFPLTRRHALQQYAQPGRAGRRRSAYHSSAGRSGRQPGYRDVDALIDVLASARSYGESPPAIRR